MSGLTSLFSQASSVAAPPGPLCRWPGPLCIPRVPGRAAAPGQPVAGQPGSVSPQASITRPSASWLPEPGAGAASDNVQSSACRWEWRAASKAERSCQEGREKSCPGKETEPTASASPREIAAPSTRLFPWQGSGHDDLVSRRQPCRLRGWHPLAPSPRPQPPASIRTGAEVPHQEQPRHTCHQAP